ncbi:S49 family peptidase, partial [Bartonella sp. AU15XJBT]
MFVDLVAQNRRLNADAIRDTKAETFIGTQAIALGLADVQGTLAQALEALTDSISQNPTSTTKEGQNTWHAHNTALRKRMTKRLSTSSMTRKRTKTIMTSTKTPKSLTTKKTKMRTKTMRTMKTSAKI